MNDYTVYNRDARDMAEFVPAKSIDLILTDPPYWNEVVYSQDAGQLSAVASYQEFLHDIGQVWNGCAKALKPGGIMAFFAHDFYRLLDGTTTYIPFHADLLKEVSSELLLQQIAIWDRYLSRDKGSIPNPPVSTRYMYMLIFKKQGKHEQSEKHIHRSLEKWYWQPVWQKKTQPKLLGSKLLFKTAFYGAKPFARMLTPIKQHINQSKAISDPHRFQDYLTECPPEIVERLMKDFSQVGDTVLDPFLGSGTVMKVAKQLGRSCIGVEINADALPAIKAKVGSFKLVN